MRVFIPRFLWAILYFVILTVVGVVGYVVLQEATIHDALYMTVITLTAVGYSEVLPLTVMGRNFTMILLVFGITGMGLWFALITSFIVELDLKDVLRRRRTMTEIEKLRDHIVICGAGRTGRQVMEELLSLGQPFVGIEHDAKRVEVVHELYPNVLMVMGDATLDVNLTAAGVEHARGLVTCLNADTDNVFVCLSARDLNPELTIVARASEDETVDKMYRAGADHVVSPNVSGAIRMASMLLRPEVVSFLDIASRSPGLNLRMEQASIAPDSRLAGLTLMDARIPQQTGLLVIALRKVEDEKHRFVFNPAADTRLDPGDEMIVMGKPAQIAQLKDYVKA
ncbi:MAG: potassium channel protein [Gemmatimonadota bacterium]|nr:MAG: potassium channel protein [Gemmatimonadota bacterium]